LAILWSLLASSSFSFNPGKLSVALMLPAAAKSFALPWATSAHASFISNSARADLNLLNFSSNGVSVADFSALSLDTSVSNPITADLIASSKFLQASSCSASAVLSLSSSFRILSAGTSTPSSASSFTIPNNVLAQVNPFTARSRSIAAILTPRGRTPSTLSKLFLNIVTFSSAALSSSSDIFTPLSASLFNALKSSSATS